MKRTSFSSMPCSIARTVDLIGDWWTPLVLREAFFGTKRFDEMQRVLGIGRNVLTERLRRLVDEGLMERQQYSEHPPRYEYLLTEKGTECFQILVAMMKWGDRWLDKGDGAPLLLRHKKCGEMVKGLLVCEHCGEPLESQDFRLELGPGFPEEAEATSSVTFRSSDHREA